MANLDFVAMALVVVVAVVELLVVDWAAEGLVAVRNTFVYGFSGHFEFVSYYRFTL